MAERNSQPWATGPAEILKHGLDLLAKESDTNRRLAMISIDNSVELMIKTYISLPKRINELSISRKQISDASESFPKLLDALETHAEQKLDGIDLGEIEWYHRLRNELYHQGNGLTVERDKVEVYSELAKLLFKNLFGIDLLPSEPSGDDLLGKFMAAWARFERRLHSFISRREGTDVRPMPSTHSIGQLVQAGVLTREEMEEFDQIRRIRNEVVHGVVEHHSVLSTGLISRLEALVAKIPGDG